MYTIYDFDISYNDFERPALNLEDVDFNEAYNLYIATREKGKSDLSPTFAIYIDDLQDDNPIAELRTNYTGIIGFEKIEKITISGDKINEILKIIDKINQEFNIDAYKFFTSEKWHESEVYNRLVPTNDSIWEISKVISEGCLDFKLDEKFVAGFTKRKLHYPDQDVPIDMDAFHFDHMLKIKKS